MAGKASQQMYRNALLGFTLAASFLWGATSALAEEGVSLRVEPKQAVLQGNLARLQLQVTGWESGAREIDLTRAVQYESQSPDVLSVDKAGRISPVASGSGRIRVTYPTAQAAVEVSLVVCNMRPLAEVSYLEDVIPVLSKAGCNQGACHAAQHGKGGLKLSLLGYAPEEDFPRLTRDWGQRRVSVVRPEDSLILRKPTLQVPHGGGKRFARGSYEYDVLAAWVAAGVPRPLEGEADVVDLTVSPSERVYRIGEHQQLRVVAHYRDGTARDVTNRAKYDSLGDGLAKVDRAGYVTVVGSGQAAMMVRYQGQAKVSLVVSPFAESVDLADFRSNNFVDELVQARWQQLGLKPSGLCSDEQFIRRAFLDCIGTLPAPERVEHFLASPDPQKREALVDELLGLTGDPNRDVFVDAWSAYWALKWGDLLRINRFPLFTGIGDGGMWTFYDWLRQSLRDNKPVDEFVHEILTAEGSVYRNGPANFFKISKDPLDLAETTAQVFLGVRLQCARCHHHPFEVYSQADFYGLAAFFARVGTKSSPDFGALGEDTIVRVTRSGSIKHPRTGEVLEPTLLLGGPIAPQGVRDLRRPLADWITSPSNPLLARNIVNRIWGYFLGTGLVEPIDDMRATNPPSNPQLLDALAEDFVAGGYDLRKLMRTIMTSRVYQLRSTPTPENAADTRFYSHYNVKRLPAEVLLDAINFACGTEERFLGIGPLGARAAGVPPGTRAIELPDPNYQSTFLDTLGRPKRVIACECERTAEPNLAQVLLIANSEAFNNKLRDKDGRIAKLVDRSVREDDAVRELYLVTVSRPPTSREIDDCRAILKRATNRREGLEDVLWALSNCREFLFNH